MCLSSEVTVFALIRLWTGVELGSGDHRRKGEGGPSAKIGCDIQNKTIQNSWYKISSQ